MSLTSSKVNMENYLKEQKWEGNALDLANKAKYWLDIKKIGDPDFIPNERIVRDYVARGIITRPERRGKEAVFSFLQLSQFLACRSMLGDGWPLQKISEDFQISSLNDILNLIPGDHRNDDSLSLIEEFKSQTRKENNPSINASYEDDDIFINKNFVRSRETPSISSFDRSESFTNASEEYSVNNEEIPEIKKPGFFDRFKNRTRKNYQMRSDIKDVLQTLGSDLTNVIKEDFTAYQLATWLILMIDQKKAENITKEEADAIGRGITAALLNKNYLTKEEIGKHRSQINNLVNNKNNRDHTEEIQLLKLQLNEKERRIEELYNQLKFKNK